MKTEAFSQKHQQKFSDLKLVVSFVATQKLILVLKLLYHSSYRNFGPGQQCCFDSSGDIIVGPPGGGTADLVAPTNWKTNLTHLRDDVVPYFLCCKGRFRDCSRYYDKRPSDDCSDYPERPPPGMHKNHTCLLKKDSQEQFPGERAIPIDVLLGHSKDFLLLQPLYYLSRIF